MQQPPSMMRQPWDDTKESAGSGSHDMTVTTAKAAALLAGPPKVINIGLEGFARDLQAAGSEVVHVAWAPPARGDVRLARLLGVLGS